MKIQIPNELLLCYSTALQRNTAKEWCVIVSSWTKNQAQSLNWQETYSLRISNSVQRYVADRIHSTCTIQSGEYVSNLHTLLQNIAFLKRYTGEGAAVKFKSFIDISYDNQRYVLDSRKQQVCWSYWSLKTTVMPFEKWMLFNVILNTQSIIFIETEVCWSWLVEQSNVEMGKYQSTHEQPKPFCLQ